MSKICSPIMSAENFRKLCDTLLIHTPAGSKTVVTNELQDAVGQYLVNGNHIVLLADLVNTTSHGVPYCKFLIHTMMGVTVKEGIVYYDRDAYCLCASLTKNPDKDLCHDGTTIKDASGPIYAMRAYVQTLFTAAEKAAFLKNHAYKLVDFMKDGIPVYLRRQVELTFDTNGIERSDANIKLVYDEIARQMPHLSVDQLNWAAFESGMLFVDNGYENAENSAFSKLDSAGKFTYGGSSLPGDCYDIDFLANLDFNWPGPNKN